MDSLLRRPGFFPVGFFNQSRIETAARLLLETDLKIYEVAERMGFSWTAYFCTEFKGQGGALKRMFLYFIEKSTKI